MWATLSEGDNSGRCCGVTRGQVTARLKCADQKATCGQAPWSWVIDCSRGLTRNLTPGLPQDGTPAQTPTPAVLGNGT